MIVRLAERVIGATGLQRAAAEERERIVGPSQGGVAGQDDGAQINAEAAGPGTGAIQVQGAVADFGQRAGTADGVAEGRVLVVAANLEVNRGAVGIGQRQGVSAGQPADIERADAVAELQSVVGVDGHGAVGGGVGVGQLQAALGNRRRAGKGVGTKEHKRAGVDFVQSAGDVHHAGKGNHIAQRVDSPRHAAIEGNRVGGRKAGGEAEAVSPAKVYGPTKLDWLVTTTPPGAASAVRIVSPV